MIIAAVNRRFERVIQRSFVELLSAGGYQRKDNQFYLKLGRVGKVVTVQRDPNHTHYRQIVIFTIHVHITSDDFWELNYPEQPLPVFPQLFKDHRSYVLHRHLGLFYGKQRGSQWLAFDTLLPEQTMTAFLRDLLSTRILPYLDKITSIDDILTELEAPSTLRMTMLAWLGRQEEAYSEFTKLMESRHQKGFRVNLINSAKRIGIID